MSDAFTTLDQFRTLLAEQKPADTDARQRAKDHDAQLTKPPALLTLVEATYPPELLAQGIDGDVLMVIDLDAEGGVEFIEILQSSHPEFEQPAMVARIEEDRVLLDPRTVLDEEAAPLLQAVHAALEKQVN